MIRSRTAPRASVTREPQSSDPATILRQNDRSGHTIAAPGLYPHQWNWDSALIAMGWLEIDPSRAWRELETLLAAREPRSGRVAHIAFDPAASTYEPGPGRWSGCRGADGRAISDLTQPPLAAVALEIVLERTGDVERARSMLPLVQGSHDFLMDVRGASSGEPVVVHPWETGRDNSVEWDGALAAVPASPQPMPRRDTSFVAKAQRPVPAHYRRYYGLLDVFARLDWDQPAMVVASPFRVLDPGFSACLAASIHAVRRIAEACDEPTIAAQARVQSEVLGAALDRRRDARGVTWPRDLATGDEVPRVTAALAMQLLDPGLPPGAVQFIREHILGGSLSSDIGILSTARDDPHFDADCYWRGPVWVNVTWLAALGLERRSDRAGATLLRERILRSVDTAGCREYFDANTGSGLGAEQFSWTAALVLSAAAGLTGPPR